MCGEIWEPSDELKICCSTSFASLPLVPLPQPIQLAGLERRGGVEERWGGGGPAASEAPTALVTAGRGGWEEGRRGWGGEGGGNPMRQREERQREGNASQHWEPRSPSLSLSLFSPDSVSEAEKTLASHRPFILSVCFRAALLFSASLLNISSFCQPNW